MADPSTNSSHFDRHRGDSASTGDRLRRTLGDRRAAEMTRASLVCARCGHGITSDSERIEVDQRHQHYGVNPHGYGFSFGCFGRAPGAMPMGEQSGRWSWFPGYRWQLDYCGGCGGHLGWLFATNAHRFHGLVDDRIVPGSR